jgi:hypothetical protein
MESKRRRSKQQVEDDKRDAAEERENYLFACSEATRLQRELDLVKGQMAHSQKAQAFADTMIREGWVKTDENGDIVQVSEQERLGFQQIQPSPKKSL